MMDSRLSWRRERVADMVGGEMMSGSGIRKPGSQSLVDVVAVCWLA